MKYNRAVRIWLVAGLVMVFFQIIIGGITRLTGSGLSITKWEIITGIVPPLNKDAWEIEFEVYKETPQYLKINSDMSLSEFKFIYFWEYFHRLWARLMGFVFLFPFIFFLATGSIDRKLVGRLSIVILLTLFVASLGWIMVASGLVDRPWVNAYKLSIHLSAALILYGYLLWVCYSAFEFGSKVKNRFAYILGRVLIFVLTFQIFLGGIMSGMKAGLSYPTWPEMNGEYIPSELFNSESWNKNTFIDYDKSINMSMIIQFSHRVFAYLFGVIVLVGFIKFIRTKNLFFNKTVWSLLIITVAQIVLGILTVINCKSAIPLWYGVLHQAFAIFLLSIVLVFNFQLGKDK